MQIPQEMGGTFLPWTPPWTLLPGERFTDEVTGSRTGRVHVAPVARASPREEVNGRTLKGIERRARWARGFLQIPYAKLPPPGQVVASVPSP